MFGLTPYTHKHSNMDVYNPFREWDELERAFFGNNQLAEFKTDVRDVGNAFLLEADMPGFNKKDINIEINGDCLSIRAERKNENEKKDENGGYVYRERSFGSYSRSFDISGVDADKIKADYQDGVLQLTLPKREPTAPASRRLELE